MRILVFSWRDPKHPLAGGAEQVMHEHMKGWIEQGNNVTLFSSGFKGARPNEEIDTVKIIRKGNQYLTVHFFAFLWYVFGKHERFDLIVDQFHGWPFFTPLYVRRPKLAVIQELTKEVWFNYPLPFGLNFLLGPIGYFVEPLFFLFYKRSLLPGSRNIFFMTGSESAKEELQTVGIKKENIEVVPHGVILNLPRKFLQKEIVPTIIYLGALAKDKGIEDAIKTFGLLNKKGNFQFWIIGKGDENYLAYLKVLANKLNLKEKVKFWGFVSQEDKFKLLSRAHLMVNPSIREGWGLVNIEANAVGTPVIAYNSPGLIDSVKNGVSGIICSVNSPEKLAQEILNLINDKKRLQKLSQDAITWSRNFTWEKSKEKSFELLTKIYKHA